jgi:hypothetical protein
MSGTGHLLGLANKVLRMCLQAGSKDAYAVQAVLLRVVV